MRFFRAQDLVSQGTSRPQTTSTLVDGTATWAESWFILVQLSRSLLSPGLFGLLPACNLRGTGARPMSSVIHQKIGDSIAMVLSNCFKAEIFRSSGLVPAHWGAPGRILLPVAIQTTRSDATRGNPPVFPCFSYSTWTLAGSPSLSHQVLYLTAWNEWFAETPESML